MLEVPRSKQKTSYTCGPACIAMIGAYYGIGSGERALSKAAGTTKGKGTTIEGLEAAASSLGLVATSKEGSSFADLRRWLKKGVPVIVNWFSVNAGHYSVAVLVDAKHIHLNDPETGTTRRFGLDDFMKVWFTFRSEIPASGESLILRRAIAVYPKKRKR